MGAEELQEQVWNVASTRLPELQLLIESAGFTAAIS